MAIEVSPVKHSPRLTLSSPALTVPGKGVPIIPGYESQWGLPLSKRRGCWSPWCSSWGLCKDLLAHILNHSGLQCKASSSKSSRDVQEGTELTGFWVKAARSEIEATLSKDRSTDRNHCSFVEPSPHSAGRHRWVPNARSLLNWLTLSVLSWWFPDALPYPNSKLSPDFF